MNCYASNADDLMQYLYLKCCIILIAEHENYAERTISFYASIFSFDFRVYIGKPIYSANKYTACVYL